MIQIQEIAITNFRSFKSSDNVLKKLNRINVMVGKNNVGKTNVLRAVYLFFNPETYDVSSDRNIIKQLTGGSAKDPRITISVIDDELISGIEKKYKITCDLNKINAVRSPIYFINSKEPEVKAKFKNSNAIRDYLSGHLKCVYLSTTDADIESQTEALINDLILRYFKKKNTAIRVTIEDFEKQYNELIKTFESNIETIEKSLSNQFDGMEDMGVLPKLSISKNTDITKFLLENIKLQLDDTYIQDIGNKGAGVQRASLIMLSLYLLDEIYTKENKLVLLDEPEAFLYPLLVERIKSALEEKATQKKTFQMFLTSHSRDLLKEINNDIYTFNYIYQKSEEKEYSRSKNGIEVNKYSVIEPFNRKNKYEVLKNYGLLDEINDYEYVIICEGETDKNYLSKILCNENDIPQIRWSKYSSVDMNGRQLELPYDFVGKGAGSVLHNLAYLDKISNVHRKVFVLLDGDKAGKDEAKKICKNKFENCEIKLMVLPDNMQIEDMVYDKEDYVNQVLACESAMKPHSTNFMNVITSLTGKKSVVEQTAQFIEGNAISGTSIEKIKMLISQDLGTVTIKDDWILSELKDFFYNDIE